MYKRGCRVWYYVGQSADSAENDRRTARIRSASLMVVCLSEAAAADESICSDIAFYQKLGKKSILFERSDMKDDAGLSFLLNDKEQQRISADSTQSAADHMQLLMRTPGFSQELLGAPPKETNRRIRTVSLLILLLAVLAAVFFFLRYRNVSEQLTAAEAIPTSTPIVDTVFFTDPGIELSAREALSPDLSLPLTEETLATITSIRLSEAPGSFDDISHFPGLEKLEIPQSAVPLAAELLPDAWYEIVVYGEEN